jgi:hypothetical protein
MGRDFQVVPLPKKQLGRATLTAVLVLLVGGFVALPTLLRRILARLAVLALPGLTTLLRLALSTLAGLTALLALSGLIALLILLVHIICHENFLLRK